MKIVYYEEDDTLFIELSKDAILRDESVGWNVSIGYTADGIGEITVLDAQKSGIYPLQIERVVADETTTSTTGDIDLKQLLTRATEGLTREDLRRSRH